MGLHPTLPLQADETPTSFASRLALLHRRPHLRNFLADMGLAFQGVADGDPRELRRLAHIAGSDEDALSRNAIVREGDDYRIRGQKLNKPAIRLTRIRICPQCAAEDMARSGLKPELAIHDRLHWKVASIRTCAVHEIALADLGVFDKTNTVHDFARAIAANIDEIKALKPQARTPSTLERYLLGRLQGAQAANPFLDGMEFHAAAKLCEMIGAVANSGRHVAVARYDDDDWRNAGEAGFAVAAAGADGVRAFLRELQSTFTPTTGVAHEGPQGVFDQLYKWSAFSAQSQDFDPFRELFRQHIIATMPMGPGDELFGKPVETRLIHSIRTASQEFKAHPKRLRKILDAKGVLPAGHEELHDNHVLFDAAKAQALQDAGVFDGLTHKDIETYLNTGRVHAKLLVDAGLLRPAVHWNEISDEKAWFSFARKDLDDFMARLQDGAIPVDQPAADQFDIPAAAKRANCSAMEIVRMILDKKLAWTGRLTTAEKYMAILVDLAEIKAKTHGEPLTDPTPHHVQKALKTTHAVVKALIEHEKLITEQQIHPINRCPVTVVPAAEFERFKKTYVSLTELAEERGLHPLKVLKSLEKDGVKPALDKTVFHATFYCRSDL
jgi:hypothetical protein